MSAGRVVFLQVVWFFALFGSGVGVAVSLVNRFSDLKESTDGRKVHLANQLVVVAVGWFVVMLVLGWWVVDLSPEGVG